MDAAEKNSEGKCSRKLDFSAPLLSARRPTTPRTRGIIFPGGENDSNAMLPLSLDVSNRIPFSWEQTPGKPKERDGCDRGCGGDDDDFPIPKPPPGRWFPRNCVVDSRSECDCYEQGRHCDNYDGDVEDAGKREFRYSEGLDVFSLGESTTSCDNVTNNNNNTNNDTNNGTMCGNFEPDLIFLRFLKDAKALAAASAVNGNDLNELDGSDDHQPADSCFLRQRLYDSNFSKACGLHILLPWRIKPKPCGGARNSVVAAASPRVVKPHKWGMRKTQDHI